MGIWDVIYKKRDYRYYDIFNPHEDLLGVINFLKKKGVKRVLDLGCGAGRNLIPLAKVFEVYGIDSSPEGLNLAKRVLRKKGLRVKLVKGDVFKRLPFKDNFFDAVISVQVLQHNSVGNIRKAISEIKRVLKAEGFVFITLAGRVSCGKVRFCLVKTAKKVAPRTYIPTEGKEAGLAHFIYNKNTIKKHFKGFKIFKIWKDKRDYYCFIARLKE